MAHIEFTRFPFIPAANHEPAAAATQVALQEKGFVAMRRNMEVAKQPEEDLPPPPPTFSEAELTRAKEEAYRHGFNDGEKKGLAHAKSEIAKIEQAALDVLPSVIAKMSDFFEEYNQFVAMQKATMPKLSLALAKKLLGDLPPEHRLEQLATRTITCVETMLGEPELHVYVHSQLTDKMEQRLANHFKHSNEPGDVIIHKDDTLAMDACRVEWQSGGMQYTPQNILGQLEQLIQSIAQGHMPDDAKAAQPAEDGGDHTLTTAVSQAISQQLARDEIPPIPDAPAAKPTTPPAATTANQNNFDITPDGENHE